MESRFDLRVTPALWAASEQERVRASSLLGVWLALTDTSGSSEIAPLHRHFQGPPVSKSGGKMSTMHDRLRSIGSLKVVW